MRRMLGRPNRSLALYIALPRGSMAEYPMTPPDGLSRLKVSVTRHENVHLLFCTVDGHLYHCFDMRYQRVRFFAQVQTNVCSNLIISTSSRV